MLQVTDSRDNWRLLLVLCENYPRQTSTPTGTVDSSVNQVLVIDVDLLCTRNDVNWRIFRCILTNFTPGEIHEFNKFYNEYDR